MATKSVTLKDSNGDTLYPVTDSNVVNINQQKTLAQALDGVVYAEDPTQNATPTAWVTGSDIDATQMPGASGPTIITGSVTSTSWAQVGADTFTPAKDGLYFFEVSASVFFGSSEGSLAVRLYNTSTSSAIRTYGVYSWQNWAGNYAADLMYSSMLYLTTSDTIRVDARTEHTAKSTTPTVWITQIY